MGMRIFREPLARRNQRPSVEGVFAGPRDGGDGDGCGLPNRFLRPGSQRHGVPPGAFPAFRGRRGRRRGNRRPGRRLLGHGHGKFRLGLHGREGFGSRGRRSLSGFFGRLPYRPFGRRSRGSGGAFRRRCLLLRTARFGSGGTFRRRRTRFCHGAFRDTCREDRGKSGRFRFFPRKEEGEKTEGQHGGCRGNRRARPQAGAAFPGGSLPYVLILYFAHGFQKNLGFHKNTSRPGYRPVHSGGRAPEDGRTLSVSLLPKIRSGLHPGEIFLCFRSGQRTEKTTAAVSGGCGRKHGMHFCRGRRPCAIPFRLRLSSVRRTYTASQTRTALPVRPEPRCLESTAGSSSLP